MDKAGVLVPSPILYGGAFVLGVIGQWILPVPWPLKSLVLAVGGISLAAGIALSVWGLLALRREHTSVDPALPVTALVTAGPYRLSRNPLYLSQTLMYAGVALLWQLTWSLLLLVAVVLIVQNRVIKPEEAYLQKKFPEEYETYRQQVRRWI
jgi:protein-S-isoprenylcysteine O-methyltransferase Ste14